MHCLLKIFKLCFRNAASKDWVYLVQGHCTIWTNGGKFLIGPMGINVSEILIEIHTF